MSNNPYYNPSGNPQTLTSGISASLRAEFLAIATGFSLLANAAGITSALDTGTANTYVLTPNPIISGYFQFQNIQFVALNTNTGASTINVNGIGAIAITRRDGTALQANDIVSGGLYTVIYNGTNFQLQANPLSGNATGPINFAKANSIASASTVVLDSMTGNYGHITGTTPITAVTLAAGSMRQIIFDGSLTLTNGANLVLPGAQNITTQAGDAAVFVGDGSSKGICISYFPALGITGLTKIATATLGSPAASINFLNSFSGNYDNYLIILENFLGDSSGKLQMQFAIGGTAVTSSNYSAIGNNASLNTASPVNTSFGTSSVASANLTNSALSSGTAGGGKINIFNANNAASSVSKSFNSLITYWSGPNFDSVGGILSSTGALSGFKLFLSSGGNFAAGSIVKIYGYQN